MNHIQAFLLFSLLLFFHPLNAQKEPIQWGKVDKADLDMKAYPSDTSAGAVVLADYGHLNFDFGNADPFVQVQRHRRIKILKPSALDRGTISIPYYSYQNRGKINGLKAQVITPGGERIRLKKKDFAEEAIDPYQTRVGFSFPGLEAGAIIEWSYTLISPDLHRLPTWYFQEDIPVRWSEFRMDVPEVLRYVAIRKAEKFTIEEQSESFQLIQFEPGNTTFGSVFSSSTRTLVNHFRFVQADMPALREAPYITTMDDYRSGIGFQLGATKSETALKPVLTTWSELATKLMHSEDFGAAFNRKRRLREALDEIEPLLDEGYSEVAKAEFIYNYLAAVLDWNGEYSFTASQDLDEVYKSKKGSTADLNLFLIAVLKEFGMDADPLLVSTRNHGRSIEDYPILEQFNHVMALVTVGRRSHVFDLGNRFRPAGLPHINALNKRAWVVDPDQPRWINLDAGETKVVRKAEFDLGEEGNLVGKVEESHTGYSGVTQRERFYEEPGGEFIGRAWGNSFPEARIEKLKVGQKNTLDVPLKYSYQIELPAEAIAGSGLLYLQPFLLPEFQENPFEPDERLFPVDIPYALYFQNELNINLPEGYAVEELPEGLLLSTPGDGAVYSFQVQESNGVISVLSRLKISRLFYPPEAYNQIKEFFDNYFQKRAARIVLRKNI